MQNLIKMEDREFDIVVWGASGFTGRLVVEYLLERYALGGEINWAIAGRSKEKLNCVLDGLDYGENPPSVLIADSHDPESLDKLARDTRVILTTVGPYAKYGSELVAACVRNGTHYCDLCGEVQWMRRMIDLHQRTAQETGARIVMSCGFDSIPSDFGVWALQTEAKIRRNQYCKQVSLLVRAMKGGASGGTFASLLNALDESRQDRTVAKILTDPYALNPQNSKRGSDKPEQSGARYDEAARLWTAPFVMAGVNTRVVRRTHALTGLLYGDDFRYREATIAGVGFFGRVRASLMSTALRIFFVASVLPLSRQYIVNKLLPSPGEGPSRQERENGYFNLLLVGQFSDGATIRLRVKGDRDPGYGSTSKMLTEAAICLAKDDLNTEGGCWTPVSAMGAPLFERLKSNAGLSFEFETNDR